jgi:hypothetical protein
MMLVFMAEIIKEGVGLVVTNAGMRVWLGRVESDRNTGLQDIF